MQIRLLLLASILLVGCKTTDDSGPETRPGGWSPLDSKTIAEATKGKVDFKSHVEPILEAKCTACHSGSQPAAGLNLTKKASAFADGPKGPRIVPGNPKASVLVQNISASHDSVSVMPRVGNSITKEETAILKRWIEQGANWP
jgi:uncharacterized membrane protein